MPLNGSTSAGEISAIADTAVASNRVLTIPNVLSFLRLVGVPFFFALILLQHDLAAIVLLAVASLTDLLDGQIARRLNQVSKLGEVLDPAADRFYIFATVLGLAIRGIIPWWLVVVLVCRDLTMAALLPSLRARGFTSLPVNFIGKAATFCLLYALPLILLGAGPWVISPAARIIGWAFGIWGAFLYWWAGLIYVRQARQLVKTFPVTKSRTN
ncbi:MAG: CDP-alcohol phosphatidyltransferase family protein [Propionibacterium sp.]|nr:CDP-alcohol phosphatidyltransferase family protein [Propionibacterium sp.]